MPAATGEFVAVAEFQVCLPPLENLWAQTCFLYRRSEAAGAAAGGGCVIIRWILSWCPCRCRHYAGGLLKPRGVCGGLLQGFAEARGAHERATAGGLARRARAEPASAASAWRKTVLFSGPFLASKMDPFLGSPLFGLSACLPRPLGSLFRGRRGLRLQARASPGVCALRASFSGAMEFRAFAGVGFDADVRDFQELADRDGRSKRMKFQPLWQRLDSDPVAFQAWFDGESDSASSASSCSSDHSDLSVDSETEHWSNEARLSLQEEEEETAYLAGLIDEHMAHNDIVEQFTPAHDPEEGAGLTGLATVTLVRGGG